MPYVWSIVTIVWVVFFLLRAAARRRAVAGEGMGKAIVTVVCAGPVICMGTVSLARRCLVLLGFSSLVFLVSFRKRPYQRGEAGRSGTLWG